MTYSITPFSPTDRPDWERLYRAYADFYQVPMNEQILDQVWQWATDDEQAFFGLLARDTNGQAVGLMHYRAMQSPLRGTMVGFLDDLFVDPEVRGSGLVDQMFEELKAQADKQGWPFVRWITAETNYRARAVYDRLADTTPWLTYQLNCR